MQRLCTYFLAPTSYFWHNKPGKAWPPTPSKHPQKCESDDTTSFLVQNGYRLHFFKRLKVLHYIIRIRTPTNVKQSIRNQKQIFPAVFLSHSHVRGITQPKNNICVSWATTMREWDYELRNIIVQGNMEVSPTLPFPYVSSLMWRRTRSCTQSNGFKVAGLHKKYQNKTITIDPGMLHPPKQECG